MSTNGESEQTIQKIIAEIEANLSVLAWVNTENTEEVEKHVQALKAALSEAKADLVKA
ncbi:hypothetical protein [Lentilactobacillus sp. Marseille-Q4993]|uniref:hypothetical protein n=1 Tax=Lentilactobacillus sp. Marseille-Q4993 TaxID=3039492 RepID=UPI0024BC83CF|nr:hypothetical protein [Lentilactobacillus sp. Marseille-Q4993]